MKTGTYVITGIRPVNKNHVVSVSFLISRPLIDSFLIIGLVPVRVAVRLALSVFSSSFFFSYFCLFVPRTVRSVPSGVTSVYTYWLM